MSEVEVIEYEPERVEYKSFAEEVWHTLQLIDVSEYVQTKVKFDYLPWANAWTRVMGCFPESDFEFDEPKFYPNGTGEQWITVNIRRGEDTVTRRWWLPYLNHTNQPISDPTSQQINNTRMRVLVKCLAMCGLGTELYSGEDVPDEDINQEAVTGTRKGSTLSPEELFEGRGYIDTINEALPLNCIKTDTADRIVGYDTDLIDYEAVDDLLTQFDGKAELQLWVYENVHKLQNRALRNYEKKKRAEKNAE